MTRTEQLIREWLSNPEHIHVKDPVLHSSNGFDHMLIRDRFELSYGGSISIQQGATHRCDKDSVELWYCPHRPILEPYGCPDEYGDYFNEPYSRVPISVLADYIDELEKEVKK